jgi:hypothetical protein
VEQAAHSVDRVAGVGRLAADPLERLVDGVRVGEDVVGGLPIRMLVGGAKARYPERRRISECSTEVGWRGPGPRRSFERIDDRDRIVSEKALGQYHVIRPAARIAGGGEKVG